MKGQKVVHSKGKDDWQTPIWLFNYFKKIYNFQLDAAADKDNALCADFFDEDQNALEQTWRGYGNIFVNPPYSQNQSFLEKIVDELDGTFTIAALVPSRTDTRWFHDLALTTAETIWFIKGRLKFSDSENSAPFPSCVLIFRNPLKDVITSPIIHSLEKPKDVRHKPENGNSRIKSGKSINSTVSL